jgi:PAS domain S-box-containing protein
MPVGVFTVDIDMNIKDFNSVAEKITGFSREEALQCKCYEIFRSPRCFRQCRLRDALEKGEGTGILRTQNRILRKDNIEIPIDITASVLADETEGVTGAIECFQEPFSDLVPETQRQVKRSDSPSFQNIIGNDPKIRTIIEILAVAAKTDVHILITGETGTGKDVFARCVHKASPRKEGRFIKVNCAAMPGELLESEFFGYEKGAFTDAKTDKPGRFQMAEGGTIFLDEIAELPLNLQAKLLQVLDEKTFYPLGASKPVVVDVRVLSSTNRDLEKMVAEGTFRQDLYYRLNVIAVEIPPLRDRLSDIPLLIDHFLKEFFPQDGKASSNGKASSDGVLTAEAQDLLLRYPYPGNVRELKHIIEHASVMSQGKPITPAMLPEVLVRVPPPQAGTDSLIRNPDMSPAGDEERAHILKVLRDHSWNRRKTADALSIDRTTLWRKMKRLGLLD